MRTAKASADGTKKHRIFTTSVASVYAHYIKKVETKGRTRQELDEVTAPSRKGRGSSPYILSLR